MKIGIITLPLMRNYGCFLQSFALQEVLKDIGHRPIIIDYRPSLSLFEYVIHCLKHIVSIMIGRNHTLLDFRERIFSRKGIFADFAHTYLNTSPAVVKYSKKVLHTYGIGSLIVGSDQVWRVGYNTSTIYDMFLAFAKSCRIKKISYAASFGADDWEGNPEETNKCKFLLQMFDAVSVREISGIKLCKTLLGVDAVQMPDPTLLLQKEAYDKLITGENTWSHEGKYVANYILDHTIDKTCMLNYVVKHMNAAAQSLLTYNEGCKVDSSHSISIPQWLRLIRDCDCFITDSFHGCVFAIIFNKPFVCLGNEGRGNARFDTLLGTFGLEDRMITDATPEKVLQVLNTPINWARVNTIHDLERERGINFLKANLT